MASVVVTISMPLELVELIDKIALRHYQNRSEFIRATISSRLQELSGEPTQAEKDKEFDEYLKSFMSPEIRKFYD